MIETAVAKISARVVAITQPILTELDIPDAEALLAYTARVSNPSNQDNFQTADRLLAYCIREAHWSVFEMANVVLEIEAPRDISRQILRHKSNAFQEFSQRYADVTEDMFCLRELRLQDDKNRQASNKLPADHEWHDEWEKDQMDLLYMARRLTDKWRERGAAKEVTRVLLPEGLTMSRMYVNANVRSLLHYVSVRSGNGTQLEHVDVAMKAVEAIKPHLPNVIAAYEGAR
jgi:thymidylate synthase (FAD)